jgi:hypothetical protein
MLPHSCLPTAHWSPASYTGGAMEFACASCTGIKEYSEGYNEAE